MTETELLALIRWAYELTERALFLKGHEARKALVQAACEINHKFKVVVR